MAGMLVFAGTAQAQKPGVLGIGVAIGPADLAPSSEESLPTATIMFPMNFGAFRLEPVLGIVRGSLEFGGDEESISQITLGVGAYFQSWTTDNFLLYGGPRLGIIRNSMSFESSPDPEESVTSTDKFLGAAIGGEHFFSKHFSLGAEARLTHYIAGEPEYDPDFPAPDFSGSVTLTSGVFVARFYF